MDTIATTTTTHEGIIDMLMTSITWTGREWMAVGLCGTRTNMTRLEEAKTL